MRRHAESGRRYLWTDAFAVCNYLGLARETGEAEHQQRAVRLVDRVHHTLGRHRDDDRRRGWISGLDEAEGEQHPTRGGLRIGKRLPERSFAEPFDERLEWERDGQYFHYLTKWMHALDQVAGATGEARYRAWARELARTARAAFIVDGRMFWKMSIDLTRQQVPSMGQHDPLDGQITCQALGLAEEAAAFAAIAERMELTTSDPLGLGGLLVDAGRVPAGPLRDRILAAALRGLGQLARRGAELRAPASHRLAFRELGLAIGLRAVKHPALAPHATLADEIERFWLAPEHRAVQSWTEHRDINDVMLATCLVPSGFLGQARASGVMP